MVKKKKAKLKVLKENDLLKKESTAKALMRTFEELFFHFPCCFINIYLNHVALHKNCFIIGTGLIPTLACAMF